MGNNSAVLIPTEHEEQREFVSWFRKTFKTVKIFAIPNGGSRNKIEAVKLKAEGVTSGVPDLYIPAWKLWVEMKRIKNSSLTKEQKEWRDYLISIGDSWLCCKGCEAAKEAVQNFIAKKKKIYYH